MEGKSNKLKEILKGGKVAYGCRVGRLLLVFRLQEMGSKIK